MNTKSEELFERFLEANRVPFEKIKEDTSPRSELQAGGHQRPDYLVSIGDLKAVFELKELAEDENFGVVADPANPHIKSDSRTIGDHVRRRIEGSKKQIQYGAKRLGHPSVLLIYNNLDPLQLFGTEDHDFKTAMYGELTVLINKRLERHQNCSMARINCFKRTRTRLSAPWADCAIGAEKITVTLFENVFSAVRMPYEQLPPCFDVKHITISDGPLTLS